MSHLVILLALLIACEEPPAPPPPGELVFVRDGIISPSTRGASAGEAQLLPGGGRLLSRPWKPGEVVQVDGLQATAPAQAECLPLFSIDLGDVSRVTALKGPPPDTSLAFSPDEGRRLAVGSQRGEVLVLDGWTGSILGRRRLAEAMVKHVAWAPDGRTLYAAEQSPDAHVHALDPVSLESRWSLRLADIVESSTAPGGEDIYGVYSLPSAYGLEVLPGGDLLVAAIHGWTDAEGRRRNRSQLLRLGADGSIKARWPSEPASLTIQHPTVDPAGDRVAVIIDRSADGPDPAGFPIGGVQVLRLSDLSPLLAYKAEPLKPWFERALAWQALGISGEQNALFVGYADGRARVLDLEGKERATFEAGQPVLAGDLPIVASVGWGRIVGDGATWITTYSQIPFGSAAPDLRPPTAHPRENTLWSGSLDGELRWTWKGDHRLEGLSISPDGRQLVVGAGDRISDQRRDLYGALVFDAGGPAGRGGEQRLRAFCPTAGPVFYRHAISADGRVAVAEHPYLDGDGSVKGAYQVTVLR